MNHRQKNSTQVSKSLLILPSSLGLGVAILAFIGMVQLHPQQTHFQTDKLERIKEQESWYVSGDYAVSPTGNLQNEGTIHFEGDITNYGRMGCGSCKAGTSIIASATKSTLSLKGTEPISMFRAVIEHSGELQLENEWRIKERLILKEGTIQSNKGEASHKVHFHPFANWMFTKEGQHLNTWVARTGKGSFCFPIGDGSSPYPIYLTGKHINSFYQAAFISIEERIEQQLCTHLRIRHTLNNYQIIQEGIWMIEGKETTEVVFAYPKVDPDMVVLGWKDGHWEELGGIHTTFGLSTGRAVVPDEYDAFTLGRKAAAFASR